MKIEAYTLKNKNNMEVKILNLGAIINKIVYKGKNRVIGFENYKDYIEDKNFFGATVGPVAGRISNGEFKLGDKVYKLEKNEGENHLHGGRESLAKKIWKLHEEHTDEKSQSITLKYKAKDGDGGYPGNREFLVRFTLTNDNSLMIEYFAKTDKETIVSLTNHSYFNLNKSLGEEILNHSLKIDADKYIELDEYNIPLGVKHVEDTVFDFRERKPIEIGYDHPFILNKEGKEISLACNNIKLEVKTTEPSVILYTSNGLDKRVGVCLETQWYPDGINKEFLGMNSLKPKEKYYSKTIYSFK